MSTPDHNQNTTPATAAESTGELEARQARDVAIYDNATNPTRTTRAISWAGWHLGELAGVAVPLALGAGIWDGFYVASVLAALGWAAHEVHLHRRNTARRAAATAEGDRDGGEA
ncbi:MAG TPA: hypothetical protein VJ870_18490 [Amycolatopsis sp.]|nr:hypothetical protein [Amycolatopsis sp.]